MKKLDIIIKPEDLNDVTDCLIENGASGMMLSNILGFGNQKGVKQSYRGTQFTSPFLPKMKIETVTTDDKAEELIRVVTQLLKSDEIGSGKIFVYDVEDAVRIRTGETGEYAI